jgi:hypothetical protein
LSSPGYGSQLVEEIAEHGLSADTHLNSLTHFDSLADVPIETYSNNMGFYNQLFTLLPSSGGAADPAKALAATGAPELWIEELQVPYKRRLRDDPLTVRALLATNQALDDVMVRFFDGDPADEATLFDVEMIPYIPADELFVVAVSYQPRGFGPGRLYVEAIPLGDPVAPASATTRRKIRGGVACDSDRARGLRRASR